CTRREFNVILVAASARLLACATSPPSVTPSGNVVVLTFARFPALQATGGSAVVAVEGAFPLAVVRTGEATAAALSATCTHAGCLLKYAPAANDLHCDCHSADFDLGGAVLRGPTVIPLPVYAATVQADGIAVDLG